MSISIYYQFCADENLENTGILQDITKQWNTAFNGHPYESWCWYEVIYNEGLYLYQGATKLPLDNEDKLMHAIVKSLEILTTLRNSVGGVDWCVSVEESEITWDSECKSYQLEN